MPLEYWPPCLPGWELMEYQSAVFRELKRANAVSHPGLRA